MSDLTKLRATYQSRIKVCYSLQRADIEPYVAALEARVAELEAAIRSFFRAEWGLDPVNPGEARDNLENVGRRATRDREEASRVSPPLREAVATVEDALKRLTRSEQVLLERIESGRIRAERLTAERDEAREALRLLWNWANDSIGSAYGTLSSKAVLDTTSAALAAVSAETEDDDA